ncbi:MAG: hypothetical protein JNL60_13730 [Bacteroidia bacterium]|nr:hypothetical protein [Bacteroidia bacterium]
MNVFLVHIILPETFSKKFYELISKQRQKVNRLLEERVILSYSLDMERKQIWTVIETSDEKELMNILSTFPIIKHVRLEIHELAFHQAAPSIFSDLILN